MNVNGIGQNYYQNNVSANRYNRSRAGQFYPQKQAAEESAPGSARQNANVQDIYDALKSTNPIMGQEENTVSNDSGLTVWYGDKTLEEWAATDPKYTDKAWYYVKKKYKLNVDFFAESTESDSAVFRNHVFQIIQSG